MKRMGSDLSTFPSGYLKHDNLFVLNQLGLLSTMKEERNSALTLTVELKMGYLIFIRNPYLKLYTVDP